MARAAATRERVLEGAYECVARVAGWQDHRRRRRRGVGRVARHRSTGSFPGGKDELLRDTVGWEMDRFFAPARRGARRRRRLRDVPRAGAAARAPASCSSTRCSRRCSRPSPTGSTPLITVQQHRVIGPSPRTSCRCSSATATRGLVAADVDLAAVAEYVARLSLSLIASPGRHDLDDPGRGAPPGAGRAAGRGAAVDPTVLTR